VSCASSNVGLHAASVTPGTVVYVRVPATDGKYRLVTVVGWSVSPKQLVALTTAALARKS
jgi:hypothetical protein